MSSKVRVQAGKHVLALSNLAKPLYPDGFTKGEVVDYYSQVAPALLPHIADRCLTRVRYPDGTSRDGFFEKNAPAGTPPWLRTVEVTTSASSVVYPVADEPAALVYLANLASIEMHVPQWRVPPGVESLGIDSGDGPDCDRLMVDLDPGESVTMERSARAALQIAALLRELRLDPFAKTSGNKGLQISARISATPAVRVYEFARSLSAFLAAAQSSTFVAAVATSARKGRILVDYAQNAAPRNTVCAYSLRGLHAPSVSTPLAWDEVEAAAAGTPLSFGPADVLARLDEHGDLWGALNTTAKAPDLPDPLG